MKIHNHDLVAFELQHFIADLCNLCLISSQSGDADGNRRVMEYMSKNFTSIGMECRFVEDNDKYGPSLIAETSLCKNIGVKPLLFVGHSDTVKSVGDWSRDDIQFDSTAAISKGPGVFDMKAGLVQMFYALQMLAHAGKLKNLAVRVLISPDEEISSPSSAALTRQLGEMASEALVFELGRKDNQVVTTRKGRSTYLIRTFGVEAHAGNFPDSSKNAISGMMALYSAFHSLEKEFQKQNLCLNLGTINGGSGNSTRAGVCTLTLESRADKTETLYEFRRRLHSILDEHPWSSEIQYGSFTPARESCPETVALFKEFQIASLQAGLSVEKSARVGGLSQGNFLPPDVPVLDSIGPSGGKEHTVEEWLNNSSILPKTIAVAYFLLGKTIS